MTKAVLEAESKGAAQNIVAAVPSLARAVPASLHASLMARLDRLGSAKEVAQIGAAIGREFSHALLSAVVGMREAELASALNSLIQADLSFRQGTPPHLTYLFKHALIQDVAYGTLLRDPRRARHARIAETLESRFPEIAESQPELLARHCTEAGLIEKAALLWGKAGHRSLMHSALAEATEQLTCALHQIATLPDTPALRREQIKLQVAIITPLLHVKGYASPETMAAVERARQLIEQTEALGETPEDPLLLFAVLYGLWTSSYVASNGEVVRELAAQFLALAEKQATTAALLTAHRIMGIALTRAGDMVQGRAHLDKGAALYHPAEHRPLATRFGVDAQVSILSYRSWALWYLGHPEAALADADQAIKDARAISQVSTLMYALWHASITFLLCGNYATGSVVADELVKLANEKGALFWEALTMLNHGWHLSLTGKASKAVETLISAIAACRSTGAGLCMPLYLSCLAEAYADLGRFDEALRWIGDARVAVETSGERWWEAEVSRTAGEIALRSPERDVAKAEANFELAVAIAHAQQAKSWELRAAMSMARLWRDQGKRQQAHDLLAPVYGWFTEGFDTLDLKEAKALLEQLKP